MLDAPNPRMMPKGYAKHKNEQPYDLTAID